MAKSKTVALLSGGLDSATATAMAKKNGDNVIALSFDYGQRHHKELKAAIKIAKHLNVEEHQILKVNLAQWGGSSLTDFKQVIPTQGISKNIIPNTYVPGRNTIFIALGLSLAEARGATKLVLGINAMDYSGYPDCRPDYLYAYQKLANLSSKIGRENKGVKLWAPLIKLNKMEIIQEALKLKIPIQSTWSCYSGKQDPCGVCDSCRIRNQALEKVGRPDLCNHKNSETTN
tara:strand:+ start:3072 stop:3764 length:693 start_codon:yes stop_codon:yes gene_type:complete